MKHDKYMDILSFCVSAVFQGFANYLRTEIDWVDNDNKCVLDEYNSNFITYVLEPGIYTFNDISEALLKILQPEYDGYQNAIDIEFDDIAVKTKLVVRIGFIATEFDEQSFFSTILGFTPRWDYKHYDKYISQKSVNLGSTNKIHLKCNVIDGSLVNGLRQPIIYSFVLDKLPGYKVFCPPETIQYKKINKTALNTTAFYLEDDNNKEVNFNGETLTFTLQMIKIWMNKWAFKNFKLKVIALVKNTTMVQKTLLVR